MVTEDQMTAWAETLETHVNKLRVERYGDKGAAIFITLQFGPKFVRIVRNESPNSRSVYGFIDRSNGDLRFPGGFKAPTKHVRGNMLGADPLAGCTWHGMAYAK